MQEYCIGMFTKCKLVTFLIIKVKEKLQKTKQSVVTLQR